MNLEITENYDEMSQRAASIIIDTIKSNPNGLYCFAGGDTPVRTLQLLVEAHKDKIIDLANAYYIELDEWIGIDQRNAGSCLSYLNKNLFEPANISKEHIHWFDSQTSDLKKQCLYANQYIEKHGGLTLTLLGVGVNGHLGFNEPGTSADYLVHVIDLDNTTKLVGKKYFDKEQTLSKGITLGIKQLMSSKIVIVEASGKQKQKPIQRVIEGDIDTMCPVTIVNTHPNAYLIVDKAAAAMENE